MRTHSLSGEGVRGTTLGDKAKGVAWQSDKVRSATARSV